MSALRIVNEALPAATLHPPHVSNCHLATHMMTFPFSASGSGILAEFESYMVEGETAKEGWMPMPRWFCSACIGLKTNRAGPLIPKGRGRAFRAPYGNPERLGAEI